MSSPELTVYGTPPKTPTRKHETHSNFAKSSKPLSPSPLPTLIDLGVDIGDTEHNMATPLAAVSPMHEVFSTAPSSPLPSPTRPLPPLPSAASLRMVKGSTAWPEMCGSGLTNGLYLAARLQARVVPAAQKAMAARRAMIRRHHRFRFPEK